MTIATESIAGLPDMKVSVRQVFGIDSDDFCCFQMALVEKPSRHLFAGKGQRAGP